jgi:ubiquitin carboxyl-terminal hydrolase 1
VYRVSVFSRIYCSLVLFLCANRMMNSLFTGGQQQDAHEMLRCLLSYIQDSIKLLNSHRSALASARSSAVNNAVKHVKSGGDIHSTQPSVISAVARKSEHKQSVRAESKATETQVPGNVGRITSFFARADPKPKSISDVLVKTVLVSDFIENTYEGLVERKTRCLECEDVTKRSESFQDMGVVVQKSGTSKNSTKEEDDSFEEKTGFDRVFDADNLFSPSLFITFIAATKRRSELESR